MLIVVLKNWMQLFHLFWGGQVNYDFRENQKKRNKDKSTETEGNAQNPWSLNPDGVGSN